MISPLTVVLGASPNPARYAYKAMHMLVARGYHALPVGIKKGEVAGQAILPSLEAVAEPIDTITLYLGPRNQEPYYQPILNAQPRRVIFNPGTENPTFMKQLSAAGIEPVVACTLVMLSTGQY